MSRIDIVFGAIEHPSQRNYVEQKIRGMFGAMDLIANHRGRSGLTKPKLESYVNSIVNSRRGGNIPRAPLARRYKTDHFTSAERRKLNRRFRCFVEIINQQYPLLDGEHLDASSDFPSYLNADWLDYSRFTIVLERRTNLATTYYVVPDAIAEPRNHCVTFRSVEPTGRSQLLPGKAPPDFTAMAQKIAEGLAGKAPPPYNMIGVFLIDLFWPSGKDANADWDKVYAALQQIVKNGLAKAEVKRAAAKVKGFVIFLSTEYVELKRSPRRQPDALLNALHPYDTAFFLEIVNVFMYGDKPTTDIAAASLANFLLGANLHIALNQERALVDPDYADNPSDSPYARTAANLAKLYGEYATEALEGVINARVKQVTAVKDDYDTHCSGGAAGSCTTFWYYWFEDNNPKPKFKSKVYSYCDKDKDPPPAKKNAAKARKDYIAELKKQLSKGIPAVVKQWNEIAKNPIAMSYSAPTESPKLKADGWAGKTPVRRSKKWKEGYEVRYAVSFFQSRKETDKGPWWSPKGADDDGYFAGSPNALPTLLELPIDPYYHAEGRRVYRQFNGFKEELIAVIKDNKTVQYQDKKR